MKSLLAKRGASALQFRHRGAFSGADTRDGVGNLLQVRCGQFKGYSPYPAVNLLG